MQRVKRLEMNARVQAQNTEAFVRGSMSLRLTSFNAYLHRCTAGMREASLLPTLVYSLLFCTSNSVFMSFYFVSIDFYTKGNLTIIGLQLYGLVFKPNVSNKVFTTLASWSLPMSKVNKIWVLVV